MSENNDIVEDVAPDNQDNDHHDDEMEYQEEDYPVWEIPQSENAQVQHVVDDFVSSLTAVAQYPVVLYNAVANTQIINDEVDDLYNDLMEAVSIAGTYGYNDVFLRSHEYRRDIDAIKEISNDYHSGNYEWLLAHKHIIRNVLQQMHQVRREESNPARVALEERIEGIYRQSRINYAYKRSRNEANAALAASISREMIDRNNLIRDSQIAIIPDAPQSSEVPDSQPMRDRVYGYTYPRAPIDYDSNIRRLDERIRLQQLSGQVQQHVSDNPQKQMSAHEIIKEANLDKSHSNFIDLIPLTGTHHPPIKNLRENNERMELMMERNQQARYNYRQAMESMLNNEDDAEHTERIYHEHLSEGKDQIELQRYPNQTPFRDAINTDENWQRQFHEHPLEIRDQMFGPFENMVVPVRPQSPDFLQSIQGGVIASLGSNTIRHAINVGNQFISSAQHTKLGRTQFALNANRGVSAIDLGIGTLKYFADAFGGYDEKYDDEKYGDGNNGDGDADEDYVNDDNDGDNSGNYDENNEGGDDGNDDGNDDIGNGDGNGDGGLLFNVYAAAALGGALYFLNKSTSQPININDLNQEERYNFKEALHELLAENVYNTDTSNMIQGIIADMNIAEIWEIVLELNMKHDIIEYIDSKQLKAWLIEQMEAKNYQAIADYLHQLRTYVQDGGSTYQVDANPTSIDVHASTWSNYSGSGSNMNSTIHTNRANNNKQPKAPRNTNVPSTVSDLRPRYTGKSNRNTNTGTPSTVSDLRPKYSNRAVPRSTSRPGAKSKKNAYDINTQDTDDINYRKRRKRFI